MNCNTVNECFEQLNAYCVSTNTTGYPLLINVDNYDIFQTVLSRLEADNNKTCVYMSDHILKNGLPDIACAYSAFTGNGTSVLIGFSQALMLQGERELEAGLDEMLHNEVASPAIVLLTHCKSFLEKFIERDTRQDARIIFVVSEKSILPSIRLCNDMNLCVGFKPLDGIRGFLAYMEHASCNDITKHPVLTVYSKLKLPLFEHSLFAVSQCTRAYDVLCQRNAEMILAEESYGTEEQWTWLNKQIRTLNGFSSYICQVFGAVTNLISHLGEALDSKETNRFWLLWLGMKLLGVQNNRYLSRVLANTTASSDFIKHVYLDLLDIDSTSADFQQCYSERKRILGELPEDLQLLNTYCNAVGVKGEKAIYYLTSNSEREEYELFNLLATYQYSDSALLTALRQSFPMVYDYLIEFKFDQINTKLPEDEEAFRDTLTQYFNSYKKQKITNRIDSTFLETVNCFAKNRPYNKLLSRSSIINGINKDKTDVYFFDALGVEYLSFIQAKCEEYGIVTEINVARCELPSITSENKEFEQTCSGVKKISDLDELKHHSLVYDYATCKLPIHLTRELEIIDRELKRINTQLIQGFIEKAIIVSDHGASRLAVLYGHDNCSSITLEEKSEHSGRCCRVAQDPGIDSAAYENGFSVLANYERFKGGRKANLEVHGGASLEEVVIPIVSLTRMPEDIVYCFVDPVIKFKVNQDARITLFCNVPMQAPKMLVNGIMYTGRFEKDKKHAEFVMPELKRTNNYVGDLYEGEKNLGVSLNFSIERATKEKILF